MRMTLVTINQLTLWIKASSSPKIEEDEIRGKKGVVREVAHLEIITSKN
jgi:hypothetical protein